MKNLQHPHHRRRRPSLDGSPKEPPSPSSEASVVPVATCEQKPPYSKWWPLVILKKPHFSLQPLLRLIISMDLYTRFQLAFKLIVLYLRIFCIMFIRRFNQIRTLRSHKLLRLWSLLLRRFLCWPFKNLASQRPLGSFCSPSGSASCSEGALPSSEAFSDFPSLSAFFSSW